MGLTQQKSSLALFDSACALHYVLRKSALEQSANEMFTRQSFKARANNELLLL